MVEQKYPSGRVVKNVLDNDGDLAVVQSKKNVNAGFWNYADSFTYTAAGVVSSMQLGNGKWESTQFNSRLQPTQIALGTVQSGTDKLKLNFSYGTTANNGNVLSQTITVPSEIRNNVTYNAFTAVQDYSYDSLNRLQSAVENQNSTQIWKQTFTFDRYGNRNFDTANTTTIPTGCATAVCNPTIDPATNKLIGYQFDNSGNTKVDATNRQFIYDSENKQVEVKDQYGTSIGKYFYDGDGKRVKKISATETTVFVYNASGQLVAEYSTQISQTPQVSYLTTDHLGSPRINTDANGNVTARHDFQPFGEEIQRASYGADTVRQKFTGYERDIESSLDFAQNRYYGYGHGRFTSPDDFLNDTHVSDPQSWNLYVYVRNNPLRFIDPDGQVKKDKDGNVITEERKDNDPYTKTINGKTYYVSPIQFKDGKTQVVWEVKKVTIFADNGDKIKAYQTTGEMQILTPTTDAKGKTSETLLSATESKAILDKAATSDEKPLSNITNCHGTTFASGQVWIENDQVGALMKGDGYRELGKSEKAQVSDVGIYGNADHSVRVNSTNAQGVVDVVSKGGIASLNIA